MASANRGQDLNQTLRALGDASASLAQVTGTLRQHDQGITGIIDSSQQINQSMQHAPLGAQIKDTNQVLAGLPTGDGSLGQGIDNTAALLAARAGILNDNTR